MQEATLPLSALFQFTLLRSSLDPAGYIFPMQGSTKMAWTQKPVACCCNLMGCSQRTSPGARQQEWKHLKRKKKKKKKKSEKEPEWMGEEEQFPRFSHITSVAMAISICPYLFRATASFQAVSIVLLWEWRTSRGDISTSKKWGGRAERGHDRKRSFQTCIKPVPAPAGQDMGNICVCTAWALWSI